MSDGGKNGYGIEIFFRWEHSPGRFHMKRIFSGSRFVSISSTMSVPRRELNAIVVTVKKGFKELMLEEMAARGIELTDEERRDYRKAIKRFKGLKVC